MLYHHKLWPMSLAYLRAADGIALPRGSRAFLSGSINFYRIQDPRDLTADRRWSQLGSDAAPSRSTKHVAEPWIPSETLHGCRCRGQVRFSPNLISIVGALVRPNPHQAIGNEYPIGVVHEVGVARIICGNHRLAQPHGLGWRQPETFCAVERDERVATTEETIDLTTSQYPIENSDVAPAVDMGLQLLQS